MKSKYFIITGAVFVFTAASISVAIWLAAVSSFYWADGFKDSSNIPDSVQALLTISGWIFWGGIGLFLMQIIGLVTLVKLKRHL
jgi:hypothetical protein